MHTLERAILFFLTAGIGLAQGWLWQNPLPTGSTLNAITGIDARTAVAVGDSGSILRTSDAGVTWTQQSSGTNSNLRAVAFLDAGTGIAVGDQGTILGTTDGGATWISEWPVA